MEVKVENEEKEHKEIAIRSEELQDVMGKVPPWILRMGITILFIVVIAILIGSAFFKYPDVIVAEMTLTGRYPVAQIVSRASGKISGLYIIDGQDVKKNTMLAVIENSALTEDVLFLRQLLEQHKNDPDSILHQLNALNAAKDNPAEKKELSLGEIQSAYTSFLNSLNEYDNYYSLDYYSRKIEMTRQQIGKYRTYYTNQQHQQNVMEKQHLLAEQQYVRDSVLHLRGVISSSDYDNARTSLLQSRYSLESGYASLENLLIQIGEMENNVLDMELQQSEKISVLMHSYHTATEQLSNAINSWELSYCLRAPIEGRVTFTNYWHENQFIQAGDNAFTIVPDNEDELIGKALLPISRSGKVKTGQRVIIRFVNFPDQEFGTIDGIVSLISLVPMENNYLVEIALPNGLTTNYQKTLPITHEMKATAEIVTEDISLLERFFQPIRKILKEGYE
ncbi:MAG: HlyD family secretion protein [Tannerella sp.]|jgi:HlyD family secretion protein|nr:HlyD family secretion protein [Tannerella sp.]